MTNTISELLLKINANYVDIAKELAPEIHQNALIEEFSRHKTKIAWICAKGHIWEATLYKRETGSGCIFCSGKSVLIGFNDLASKYPEIAKEWHPTKNINMKADEVMSGSSYKAWWLGRCGHEWEAVINSRVSSNRGCPYCSNQKVLIGFNDLEHKYPAVANQWHPTKNLPTMPSQIIAKTNKKFFWICKEGHSFTAPPLYLIKNMKCGVCANLQTEVGVNSLLDTNPELEKEYHSGNKKPFSEYRKNSKEKVLWKCAKGHIWEAAVYKRAVLGRMCHECSGFKLSKGNNDFVSQATEQLIKEFYKPKNTIKIEDLFVSSRAKVWWKCAKGHIWEAYVYSRTSGNRCPRCANQISNAEEELKSYLTDKVDCIQNDRKIIKPQELDLYVPDKKVAIEYNGLYWHSEDAGKDRKYHYNKWLACKNKGIQLIQIWEDDYIRNPELVKNMLAHKLGVSQRDKVYARKTVIKTLTKYETDTFLNANHIQGSVDGKIRIGLFDCEMLVAVMVLKTEARSNGKTLNLLRFATSANVVGGFTKLLTWAEKTIPNVSSIVTFSDNTVSDGGLYKNNGFIVEKILEPDYMYLSKGKRSHKFNYRISRFKNDPNLLWQDGLTESQLAKLNNLTRIWDAGKVKWIKAL